MPNPADVESVLCSKKYRTSPNVNSNPITLSIISVLAYQCSDHQVNETPEQDKHYQIFERYIHQWRKSRYKPFKNYFVLLITKKNGVFFILFSDTTTSRLRRHNLGRQEQLSTNELSSNTGKQSCPTNTRCSSPRRLTL